MLPSPLTSGRINVPLLTFTKCVTIVLLAAAAYAGENGGNLF